MKIFDLHSDALTKLPHKQWLHYFEKLPKNINIVTAIFTTEIGKDKSFELLQINNKFQNKNNILQNNDKELPQTQLSIEDCGCFSPSEWERLLSFNPLCVTLTWNYENILGGGALSDGNLTPMGREFIALLNKHKIIIDLAHLNRKSYFQALELADYPIVTHTALDTLHKHPRNLTDEQIRLLIQKNGLIGLCLVKSFYPTNISISKKDTHINKQNNNDPVIRTIDYFCSNFSSSNLCIGTDFFGTTTFVGTPPINSYIRVSKIFEKLSKMGYNNNDIDNITNLNAKKYIHSI